MTSVDRVHNVYRLSKLEKKSVNFSNFGISDFSVFIDREDYNIELIKESRRHERSEAYLQDREAYWLSEKDRHNGNLWNGIILTVNEMIIENGNIALEVGQCEYKDILYKRHLSANVIRDRYPKDLPNTHSFTCALPIVDRDNYAFVEVGENTIIEEGKIDLCGGTLNLDERKIDNIEDVLYLTQEELKEEMGLAVREEDLRLLSINYRDGVFFFVFSFEISEERITNSFYENGEVKSVKVFQSSSVNFSGYNVSEDIYTVVSSIKKAKV